MGARAATGMARPPRGATIAHFPRGARRGTNRDMIRAANQSAEATELWTVLLVILLLIIIYRAPILIGEGQSSLGYVGLDRINDAHGRWRIGASRDLGIDRREVYERIRDEETA